MSDENKSEVAVVRLRDLAALAALIVLTWKLLISDIEINIASVSVAEILSVLVSFFAIALSAAFYFKASETSNRFYDNSYRFTQDVSEILGRIESGFGEKLRQIDEGTAGIRERFDQLPLDARTAKEEIEAEAKDVEEKVKERGELIDNLLQRAQLAEAEKTDVLEKMKKMDEALEYSRRELTRAKNFYRKAATSDGIASQTRQSSRSAFERMAAEVFFALPSGQELEAGKLEIQSHVDSFVARCSKSDSVWLYERGYIDEEMHITSKALGRIRHRIRSYVNPSEPEV